MSLGYTSIQSTELGMLQLSKVTSALALGCLCASVHLYAVVVAGTASIVEVLPYASTCWVLNYTEPHSTPAG